MRTTRLKAGAVLVGLVLAGTVLAACSSGSSSSSSSAPPVASSSAPACRAARCVRMGDREIPQFNRILFAKFGNRTQELHLQRLRQDVKPVIDTQPPPSGIDGVDGVGRKVEHLDQLPG